MKVLYEFIPKSNFPEFAEEIKDLLDGWNITDSASGIPAPSAAAVACALKAKYPEKLSIPMLITNYKGPVEIAAAAKACEAMGIEGMVPDPGDAPKFGHPIKTSKDGSCVILTDEEEFEKFRRSTGPAEEIRDFLRNTVKIQNLRLGCLVTSRRPVEDAIARIKDQWDFCFFLRLDEQSLPKLKDLSWECKKMGKAIYPYFVVETPKNKKILERIGWSPTTSLERAVEFAQKLEGIVDGIIATCLGDLEGDRKLLEVLQKVRG
ncbi:MAG: hypothetical protein N2257_07325 [Thermodesulfovibrionales bacterium]|nr:hypothetical protein [Thermodesulfovibrionales bacterium]